jgi:hypothetical protein
MTNLEKLQAAAVLVKEVADNHKKGNVPDDEFEVMGEIGKSLHTISLAYATRHARVETVLVGDLNNHESMTEHVVNRRLPQEPVAVPVGVEEDHEEDLPECFDTGSD